MNPEFLSRFLFSITSIYHFIYPPISIGLGLMMVLMGLIYVRSGNLMWRRLSFFWVKVYALVFAMGIATGIVLEFEFGTNWADYSRFVGNIFGSLLAAEGVFAFFLEGGFLGLMLFGGRRLGPRMWLLSTFLVAFGAHFSALWIIMANSWMQTPAGYALVVTEQGTRAIMTSFIQVMFTPSFLTRLGHTLVASWLIGSSLVLSVSAWYLLKKKHVDMAKAGFRIATPLFFVLAIVQLILLGASSAEVVTEYQPTKLAAMEGLWETQSCAPMMLVGWVDEESGTTTGIAIPCMLSVLAYGDPNAIVTGLNDFPPEIWPPVNLTFQSYHLMLALGMLFIMIGLLGVVFLYWRQRIFNMRWLLWLFVSSIFLTEIATAVGWMAAEIGRQPWIVYNLLRTADAVSPVLSTGDVLASVLMFMAIYAILFILFIYLLNSKIQHGPDPLIEEVPVSSLPDTFREIFRRPSRTS
jgi:cytochrome d ubiquinol oxidase subunit I